MSRATVVGIEALTKVFAVRRGTRHQRIRAVNGVSFSLQEGRTLGLVGESGCGKTTIARMILGAERPSSGRVLWRDVDVATLPRRELRGYRAAVQAVFQDPSSSLNPRMKVGTLVAEPLRIHRRAKGSAVAARVDELLAAVRLPPKVAGSFPHELSGGMRQRVAIARALALDPEVLVLDEPVSSLDVSVRAQIMNLLKRLQQEFGFACLLIAHDLASVRYMANEIAVMYLGHIVEMGSVDDVFKHPLHPYTVALTGASLSVTPHAVDESTQLVGEIPSPLDPPTGCPLHTRCPVAFEPCPTERPALVEVDDGHWVACHLHPARDHPAGTPVGVGEGLAVG